jgi:DNA repair protein RadA/Sms
MDEVFEKEDDGKLPEPVRLTRVGDIEEHRVSTQDDGFDLVLGGGLIPGVVVLLSGDPGIGKSTLLLQVADSIGEKMLYVNGEESAMQTSMRAERLGINPEVSKVLLLPEQNVEKLLRVAEAQEPTVLAVDSIQTLWSDEVEGAIGTVSQVRECTSQLVGFAKRTDIPVVIIGHITKSGSIAGPKAMEHEVDVVMAFTQVDDILRDLKCSKNRFGTIIHCAQYAMEDAGLRYVG